MDACDRLRAKMRSLRGPFHSSENLALPDVPNAKDDSVNFDFPKGEFGLRLSQVEDQSHPMIWYHRNVIVFPPFRVTSVCDEIYPIKKPFQRDPSLHLKPPCAPEIPPGSSTPPP